jgi:hypothetical protein
LDFIDYRLSAALDISESEIFLFVAVIIQMGQDIYDSLKDGWSTAEQFFSPLYGKMERFERFLHILRFFLFMQL